MAFVQLKSATTATTANSLATPSFTSTTGNMIIVVMYIFNGSIQTVSSMGDGTNTYQLIVRNTSGLFSGLDVEIWAAPNITGVTSVVTAHWPSGGGGSTIYAAEYSGLALSGIADTSGFTGNTSTSPTLSYSTVYWHDLIIASCVSSQSSVWIDSGYGVPADRTGTGGLGWADLVLTTTTALTLSTTVSTSAQWVMTSAGFKFPSGSSGYEWINAGTGVQLPVVGLTPSSTDASMTLTSPDMVSTPVLGIIPSVSFTFTSPIGPSTTTLTTGYSLIGSLLSGGYTGMPWTPNTFALARPYLDSSLTWPNTGQEN